MIDKNTMMAMELNSTARAIVRNESVLARPLETPDYSVNESDTAPPMNASERAAFLTDCLQRH